jgi:hypothetical protein
MVVTPKVEIQIAVKMAMVVAILGELPLLPMVLYSSTGDGSDCWD